MHVGHDRAFHDNTAMPGLVADHDEWFATQDESLKSCFQATLAGWEWSGLLGVFQ